MKKVKVQTGFSAIVYKNKSAQRVLTAGDYWLGFSETAVQFSMAKAFEPAEGLEVALNQGVVNEFLHIIDVKDNEVVVRFERGRIAQVLFPGIYAFWKGFIDYSFIRIDRDEVEIESDELKKLANLGLMNSLVRKFSVETVQLGVLFIDKQFVRILNPGTYAFWNNNSSVQVSTADMRNRMMEVAGQELLTRDKASIRMSMFVQFKVVDIIKALVDNTEYEKQLYTVLQLVLREYIGTKTLDEILENKESIAVYVLDKIKTVAISLGVQCSECGIRDVILPGEMKEIMNRVLIAEKQAQANTIMRREETASTRSLLNTAKLMEENQTLWKLKEMEYVERIAEKIGSISVNGNGKIMSQLKEIFSTSGT